MELLKKFHSVKTAGNLNAGHFVSQKLKTDMSTSLGHGVPLLSPPPRDICLSTSNVSNDGGSRSRFNSSEIWPKNLFEQFLQS
jgi:hypothetical protein